MSSTFSHRRVQVEELVRGICETMKMPFDVTSIQRTIGPQPNVQTPSTGSEIFVSGLPKDHFEDRLLPMFMRAGKIYKFRLIVSDNRRKSHGCVYVTYFSPEEAKVAERHINEVGKFLYPNMKAAIIAENRRLFLGGIPEKKSRDQVWNELNRIGVQGIVDIIMYRSYLDRNLNRGYVFVEFSTQKEAERILKQYKHRFVFGNRVLLDWASPMHEVDMAEMAKVKKLFLRNLNALQERDEFANEVEEVMGNNSGIEKIYKCRDYAFIHFSSRRDAQRGMSLMKEHYKRSHVEVVWAKPPPSKEERKKKYFQPTANDSEVNEQDEAMALLSVVAPSREMQAFNNAAEEDGLQANMASADRNGFYPPMYCHECSTYLPGNPPVSEQEFVDRYIAMAKLAGRMNSK